MVSSLTGMPTPAACFLLPLGVVVYTMFGGIKATFLTDWVSFEKFESEWFVLILSRYIHSCLSLLSLSSRLLHTPLALS